MDVLEELSLTIDYIVALSLDIECFLWDVEYINITFSPSWGDYLVRILFPSFFGKLWTPEGLMAKFDDSRYFGSTFMEDINYFKAYNGVITHYMDRYQCINLVYKDGRRFYISKSTDMYEVSNDDPENLITTCYPNEIQTTTNTDFENGEELVEGDDYVYQKSPMFYIYDSYSGSHLSCELVEKEPYIIDINYYCATSLQDIRDNYDKILKGLKLKTITS